MLVSISVYVYKRIKNKGNIILSFARTERTVVILIAMAFNLVYYI